MPNLRTEFFQDLERLGEQEVRIRLRNGNYGDWKKGVVEEWLRQRDQERADAESERISASNREQIIIARSAKNAAWAAAIAAIIAAICAVIAVAS